ncbi:hypothetical protein L1987_34034 [Smallanthus sonchifolius]|uniref:Uncharacterized protein n=1 Tax=Smallanthus sonchifolius TaxID=185202 RepID=A0ACB9HUE6_9ASTR|nr:hypothetical protein L1987_34034 [Smallanthus sonchifolius]
MMKTTKSMLECILNEVWKMPHFMLAPHHVRGGKKLSLVLRWQGWGGRQRERGVVCRDERLWIGCMRGIGERYRRGFVREANG